MKAVLSLGGNIGDVLHNFKLAIKFIDNTINCSVIKVSDYFITKPWGFIDQPDFLNCTLLIETSLSPHTLLGVCLGIEAAIGRERSFKNAPRLIDIDILLYENFSSSSAELSIPHPLIKQRDFVLFPLYNLLDSFSFCDFDFEDAYHQFLPQNSSSKDYIPPKIYKP